MLVLEKLQDKIIVPFCVESALLDKVNLCTVEVSEVHLWEVDAPNLYDISYTLLLDGKETDNVQSYFGIRWGNKDENASAWGYGNAPKTEEKFIARYCGLAKVLLTKSNVFGLCYTQLYDIEQEQNGLYYYDRTPKFSEEVYDELRDAMLQKAAIED